MFAQLVQESKKPGIKTIAHIKTWQDIRDAAEVGVSAVTHVPRGEIPKDIAGLMANSDVAIIPTLTVHSDFVNYLFDPSVLDAPLLSQLSQLVPGTLISAYRSNELIAKYQDRKISFQQRNEVIFGAIRAMSDADVKILVGTDAGNWNTIQGYSVHREMKLLTDAGISPLQAIASATTHSADFLGIKSGFNEGDHANFVILNTSPVEDILNTQQISLVVKNGNIVVQNDLSLSKL